METIMPFRFLPGFNSITKNYLTAFMDSYMLVESFKYIENAKFILVCDEGSITRSSLIEDIIRPLYNFMSMFKRG